MNNDNFINLPKRRRKWPFVAAGLVLLAGLVFSGCLYVKAEIKKPNSQNPEKKYFVIEKGEGSGDIATRLKKDGLLRNRFVFILYLNYKKIGDRIQAGEYQIPQNLNITELAGLLSTGKIATTKITIPEGWTVDQIDAEYAKDTDVKIGEFKKSAVYDLKYSKYKFLSDLKEGESLEGFLYPDTYQLSVDPKPQELITKMLDNFNTKFNTDLQQKAKSSNLSTYEIITLASIVEREVSKPEDRRKVASVFLNRLDLGMPLESCATIQYILKSDKTIFTYEETRTESPYNTYINKGLPPGPIGNPSIDSINAVLNPENTDYLYFLSAKGVTYYSNTLEEHNAKKAQYLY